MAAGGAAAAVLPLPAATPVFLAPAGWQAIDFISDLHLAESVPQVFDAWAAHMAHTRADAVFILGDLFDMWVGDDAAAHGFEARCAEVMAAAARRIDVAFMIGNRDFLVGRQLLGATGVSRLADPTVIEAFGSRALVTHGDALCIADEAYQRYRRVVNRRGMQRVFSWLPLRARSAIGAAMRQRSRSSVSMPAPASDDVDAASALAWACAADAPVLIHGHTHAPASHAMDGSHVRHVLSDWALDGAAGLRAQVLRWDRAGFRRIAPQGPP